MTKQYSFTRLLLILILGLALSTTFWSYNADDRKPKKDNTLADAYMENVSALIMDKYGKVKIKIDTPKLSHYPFDDATHLVAPTFTLYRNTSMPWYINAKFGKTSQGIATIYLWDDVTIHQPASKDNPATLIKTPTLTIHSNDNTAETDDIITLNQPSLKLKAKGMFADMNSGDIKLLAKTQGEYFEQKS